MGSEKSLHLFGRQAMRNLVRMGVEAVDDKLLGGLSRDRRPQVQDRNARPSNAFIHDVDEPKPWLPTTLPEDHHRQLGAALPTGLV